MGVNRIMPHWQVERDIEAAGLPHVRVQLFINAVARMGLGARLVTSDRR